MLGNLPYVCDLLQILFSSLTFIFCLYFGVFLFVCFAFAMKLFYFTWTNKKVFLIYQERNTGMGCYFLLQRIFLTQESNLHLLRGRQILYN